MSTMYVVVKRYDKVVGEQLTLSDAQNLLKSVRNSHPEAKIMKQDEFDRKYRETESDRIHRESMEGLVLQPQLLAILRNAEEIIHDFCQEGFEVDEAVEFLCEKLRRSGPYA